MLYFDMLLLSWYFSLSLMPNAPELQITGGWESNLGEHLAMLVLLLRFYKALRELGTLGDRMLN